MVEEKRSQYAATGFAYHLGSNTANRYEDGYLIREFPIKSIQPEEATPPVDELTAFNQVSQDPPQLAAATRPHPPHFTVSLARFGRGNFHLRCHSSVISEAEGFSVKTSALSLWCDLCLSS